MLAKVSLVVALAIAGGGNLLAKPYDGNIAADTLKNEKQETSAEFNKAAKFEASQELGKDTTIVEITNSADKIGGDSGDKTLTIAKDNANDISITNKSTTAEGWNAALTHNGSGTLTITNGSNETEAAKWTKNITQAANAGLLTINNSKAATISGDITSSNAAVITNHGTLEGAITGGAGALQINNQKDATIGGTTDKELVFGAGGGSLVNDGTMNDKVAIKGSDTATTEANKNTTTITNTSTGTIAGAITGQKGDLVIHNQNGGTIKEAIKAGAGAVTIYNAGTINVDSGNAKKITLDAGTTKIVNGQDGISGATNANATIGHNIEAGKANGVLELTNYGKITGNIDATTTNNHNNQATITNHSGATISGKITMAEGAADKVNTITNHGTIGDIDMGKDATTQAYGSLTNTGTISGVVNMKGYGLNVENSGKITNAAGIKFTGKAGETNTLNNSGAITKVTTATGGTLHITGGVGGVIDNITIEKDTTVQLGSGYAVDISSDRKKADGSNWTYDTDGAINVTLNDANSKLEIGSANARAGEKAFVIADMDIGKAYDLNNFIKNTNNATSTGITTQQIAQNIGFTNNLYSAAFDANGIMTISVEANKSIGALGAIQTIASMNSQINRATNIIDSVFDSVATGEIGTFNYPREGAISNPYIGVGKKSKLDELAEAVEAEKDPKAKEEKLALLLAEKEKANKAWIGFVTPYFSSSSISATGFAATSGQSFGFVGGAAKLLDNGVMFGAHLGVESSNAGKVGQEMQSQGTSFMLGVHTKMPLGNIAKESLAIIPFVKVQANAMMAMNSYRLTPLLDTTREASGLVSAFSGSAVFGIDMPASFGYITPEIGLMAQAINMPSLTYKFSETSVDNQVINATTATPLYMLAQVRYTKAIKLEKMSLFPTFKAGMRYAVMGNTFTSAVVLQNSNYFATNNIDSFVGVIEAGLGAKLGQNASVNLSYGGEFGSQVKTHNISVRAGWQF